MKLFGKQLFGKKSDDEDEDDEDFELDDSDFEIDAAEAEADELNEALAAQSARDIDDDADGIEIPPDDLPNDDLPDDALPPDDGDEPGESGPDTSDIDLDDIDFGDDEGVVDEENGDEPSDEDVAVEFDDEDFELDDEDDDDEDETRSGLFANPIIRYAAFGFVGVLLLGGAGLGAWFFVFADGDDGEQIVAEEQQRGIEIAPLGDEQTPTSTALNDITSGGGLQPPAPAESTEEAEDRQAESTLLAETPEQAAADGDVATFAQATSSGLNALGGGLNALSPGTTGSGVVIPVTTASSFSRYPDLPSGQPLVSAPEPDLMEIRGEGVPPLPKKGQDGRTPFNVYARPAEVAEGQRSVALVVTELGLNRAGTIAAIRKLPAEVTLSFSPYAEELGQWMVRARRAGHEVLVGLPMESDRFPIEDPGPLGLMTVLSSDQNMGRFYQVLSLFQGHIGVEIVMGERYSIDPDRVRDFVQVLADRGLMVLDNSWNQRSTIPQVARELSVPLAISDLRLDTVMARSAIEDKLRQLEDTARTRGVAIGTTSINPAIVDRLTAWFVALQINNIELVPLSALVNRQDFS